MARNWYEGRRTSEAEQRFDELKTADIEWAPGKVERVQVLDEGDCCNATTCEGERIATVIGFDEVVRKAPAGWLLR